jgi:hypothetical protein
MALEAPFGQIVSVFIEVHVIISQKKGLNIIGLVDLQSDDLSNS